VRDVQGILFDKDGTLFDFKATWNAWAKAMLLDLAQGVPDLAAQLGQRIKFDFAKGSFERDSPIIAGTPFDVVDGLAPALPNISPAALLERINALAAEAPQIETVPLAPLLARLRGAGIALGVATNDAEAPATQHLKTAVPLDAFDFIAGYDSGYGAKPEPGMCLAFAEAAGLAPDRCVMVGDSTHDLLAGRAAGMATLAVLTGMAPREALAGHADAVLPDIGHIPDWLGLTN
jgi:phosphoglycolate phosphatase